MNRKKRLFLVLMILPVFFLSFLLKEDVRKEKAAEPLAEQVSYVPVPVYYMKLTENQVVIYHTDHSIYEFTDLDIQILPKQLIQELKSGKYFHSQQELYEFLETYTS